MPRIGEIRRLSSATNVCDCADPVRKYLLGIGPKEGTIGLREVWVRYGPGPRGRPGGAMVVAVGPTEESVRV